MKLQKFNFKQKLSFTAISLIIFSTSLIIFGGDKYPYISLLLLATFLNFILFTFLFYPKKGIFLLVIIAFLVPFFNRLFGFTIPFGLAIDISIVIIFYQNVIKQNKIKTSFYNILSILWTIWFFWIILMYFNPLAKSKLAWLYAMRSIALYPLLLIPSAIAILKSKTQLISFVKLIITLGVIGSLWGIKQHEFGLLHFEQVWLDSGALNTHINQGVLRIFSFFTDASQFGTNQAYLSFVSLMFVFFINNKYLKLFFLLSSFVLFYGLIISGTRAAFFTIIFAAIYFMVFSKNRLILTTGLLTGLSFFIFLNYTNYLNNHYNVRRMRTILKPQQDHSFLVRKEREIKLSKYLADKPIGEGVGSAGYWGKRFSPNSYLANIGTDGLYTRIWMETGIIGLIIYLLIIALSLIAISVWIWKIPDKETRLMVVTLASMLVGLIFSSYANELMTQLPTGIITYLSLGIIYNLRHYSKKNEIEAEVIQREKKSLNIKDYTSINEDLLH